MEINWYGHSCFRLSERGMASVVTDPYDSKVIGYEPLKLKADIVTVSHDSPGHNNVSAVKGTGKGDPKVITGQGEYEIGEVFITGIQTDGIDKKHEGEIKNTLYVFDYYGLTVAHMGDMTRVPTQVRSGIARTGPYCPHPGWSRRQPERRQSRRSRQPAGAEHRDPHALRHRSIHCRTGSIEQVHQRDGS